MCFVAYRFYNALHYYVASSIKSTVPFLTELWDALQKYRKIYEINDGSSSIHHVPR